MRGSFELPRIFCSEVSVAHRNRVGIPADNASNLCFSAGRLWRNGNCHKAAGHRSHAQLEFSLKRHCDCPVPVESLEGLPGGIRMRQGFSPLLLPALLLAVLTAEPLSVPTTAAQIIQQSQSSSTALNNQDVLAMLKADLAVELIVAKIKASDCNFDTSPETLKKFQTDGVPGEVIMAMIVAAKKPWPGDPVTPTQRAAIKLPAGTVIDFETVYPINSHEFRKDDAISFRVVNPVIINGSVLIIQGATATGIVTIAQRNGHFGRAGRITWAMKEVTAVDGTRIPIEFTGHTVGDSKGAKVAAQTIIMGALMGPAAPIALLGGFKRGENAYIPAGKRFQASVRGDATVIAYPMR